MIHKVTKLTESLKVKGRWYAEFEDGESLAVNVNLIADFSLFTGRELDEEEHDALRKASSVMVARSRALELLGRRAMSRRELTDKLTEKGVSPEDSRDAADYLESLGYLDDAQYAGSLARHYSQKGYGPARVKQELYRRGVPKELWEKALSELPADHDAIDGLIDRRLRGERPDKKERKRLTDMLLRRGFSWEDIRSALSRYDFSEGHDDE